MPELTVHRWMTGVCVVAMLLLTACAGPWTAVPADLSAPRWSISTPQGWMQLSMPESEMLSKNGPYLEYILIQSRPLTQGFRFTKQELNPGMLPHEAAGLILDNLRSDPRIRNFQLLSSEPATIAGQSGFKLTYSFQDKHGVETKTLYYGTLLTDKFFNIRYTAAQRYYFDKELSTFNGVLSSLRLVSDIHSL